MPRPSIRNNKTITRHSKRSEYQSNAIELPINTIEQEYEGGRIERL